MTHMVHGIIVVIVLHIPYKYIRIEFLHCLSSYIAGPHLHYDDQFLVRIIPPGFKLSTLNWSEDEVLVEQW